MRGTLSRVVIGLEYRTALPVAGLAMGMAACAQLALVPLTPSCLPRWQLRQTLQSGSRPLPWLVILRGATLMDALLTTRLTSALQDVVPPRWPACRANARSSRSAQDRTSRISA